MSTTRQLNSHYLRKKYWEEGLSIVAIAKEAKVSASMIARTMKKLDIPSRSISEANSLRWEKPGERQRLSELAKARTGQRNPFYGKKHTQETKNKLSKANRGKFRGENGSNWQGGKTKLNYKIRDCWAYHEWRREVFKRDKYICQICRQVGGQLHADHIKAFSIILRENKINLLKKAIACEELWDLNNGRTLCIDCHRQTDNYAGRAIKI